MSSRYCFWSVCDGPYGAMMEGCVRSARAAGVFNEFHVLCDRPLDGCQCYEAYQCDKADGLFKLHYLKVGMTRLNFDYFVWLDADTLFVRHPASILAPVGKAPIHVPLEANLSALPEDRLWKGQSCFRWREHARQQGVRNQVYASQSAFWIVHHEAIETVYELALGFFHAAKSAGLAVNGDAALGYAMQMLCADPEPHLLSNWPDLWASDDAGHFGGDPPDVSPWAWSHPLHSEVVPVRPALIHLPHQQPRLRASVTPPRGTAG